MLQKINHVLQHPHPFRFVAGMVLFKTGWCKYFVINFGTYKLRFFKTALLRSLFVNREDRKTDLNVLSDILQPGDTYVDVGANIGQLSIFASTLVGEKGKVLAFEPHPRIFRYFEANVRLNHLSNVVSYNLGLGAEPGTVYFTDLDLDDLNAVSKEPSNLKISVEVLDRIESLPEKIDLLKIDTEGYELFVLKGAISSLEKTAAIYFEANEHNYTSNGFSFNDVKTLLSSRGFDIYFVEARQLTRIPDSFLPDHDYNLLAINSRFVKNFSRFKFA